MHRYIQGTVAQPAAGHDWSDVPNYGDAYRLLVVRAVLTTSAVVANRRPHFQFTTPSGDIAHEIIPYDYMAASNSVMYDLCGAGGAMSEGSALNSGQDRSSSPLPDFWWPPGTKLVVSTTGLDAGDQWSDIYYTALVGEEWEHLKLLSEIAGSVGG